MTRGLKGTELESVNTTTTTSLPMWRFRSMSWFSSEPRSPSGMSVETWNMISAFCH